MKKSILTPRFVLRQLTAEDATLNYLSWLQNDSSSSFIVSSRADMTIEDLKEYISERMYQDDVLFLGIFDKDTKHHIGNIKFEPINRNKKIAVMGILIGDPEFRGKSVASEVIEITGKFLKENCSIDEIHLGVHKDNVRAIKAYLKVGFNECQSSPLIEKSNETIIMKWSI